MVQGLTENLNPFYLQDIEDMKPCSGAVVQKGLEKVAVYVDEQGGKHAYRAVCPHLGCLVQVLSLCLLCRLDTLELYATIEARRVLTVICAAVDLLHRLLHDMCTGW